MILRRKEFSQDSYSILDAIEERAFCEGYKYAQREFGALSKVSGVLNPTGYAGKELARLESKDADDYESKKAGAYLTGSTSPYYTMYKYKKAQKLAEKGKSPEEIRKALHHSGVKDLAIGAGETIVHGATLGTTALPACAYGWYKGLDTKDSDARKAAKKRTRRHSNDD